MTSPQDTTVIQRFSPVLVYEDADRAIDFMKNALGFEERAVYRRPDGTVVHAELTYEGATIGLSEREKGEQSVFDLGPCAVYVVVDDPDAHHARATAAGADIVYPLTDQDYGSRDYALRDHEGFVWCFGTYVPGSEAPPDATP